MYPKPHNETLEEGIIRRTKIYKEIDATNRLENILPPEEGTDEWLLRQRWIKGEITSEEMVEIIKEEHKDDFI